MANHNRSKRPWTLLAAVLAALLIAFAWGIKPYAAAAVSDESIVKDKAADWSRKLAEQPGFESWEDATLEAGPVGPGTHSWLVLVRPQGHAGAIAGYMVIEAVEGADPDSDQAYRLGEYGLGRPPFDDSARDLALLQLELDPAAEEASGQRLYVHPLLAAWSFEGKYADASSGESLPVNDALWKKASIEALLWNDIINDLAKNHSVTHAASNASFAPYASFPWLTGPPVEDAGASAISALLDKGEELRYTAERFDKSMVYVWSVTGYHQWDDGVMYAALESDEADGSRRYIPLQLLNLLGAFYL